MTRRPRLQRKWRLSRQLLSYFLINELSSSPGANDGEEALEAPLGRAEVGLGAAAARRGQVVVPGVGERRFSALVRVQLHPQHLHHNSPSS